MTPPLAEYDRERWTIIRRVLKRRFSKIRQREKVKKWSVIDQKDRWRLIWKMQKRKNVEEKSKEIGKIQNDNNIETEAERD